MTLFIVENLIWPLREPKKKIESKKTSSNFLQHLVKSAHFPGLNCCSQRSWMTVLVAYEEAAMAAEHCGHCQADVLP